MNTFLSRFLPTITLLEWGGVMLYFYFSGRIASFLHPMFRPLVLVTGLLLVVTAAVLAFAARECCSHGDDEEGHTHSHEHSAFRSVLSFFILLVPLALAASFSPNSYGENMIRHRGILSAAVANTRPAPAAVAATPVPVATPAPASTPAPVATQAAVLPGDPPLPTQDGQSELEPNRPPSGFENPTLRLNAQGNIQADVLDLVYAAEEPSMMKDYASKPVELIGQVVHRNEAEYEKGSFQVVRFLMSCCAADARPVAVLVDYPKDKPDFKSMSWVKVMGKVEFRKAGEGAYPVIVPTSVKPTPEPSDIYLY